MVFFLYIKGTKNMTKNWDDLCDEEKSFENWFIQNNGKFYKEIDASIIDLLKKIYMQGYAAGFESKRQYSAEEQLQK